MTGRILIVEDEFLVGLDLEDLLRSDGYETLGPATTPEEAIRLITCERIDAALLDANLNGAPVDAVAEALTARAIPFAFVSGYGRETLPRGFEANALIPKPFDPRTLMTALRRLVR